MTLSYHVEPDGTIVVEDNIITASDEELEDFAWMVAESYIHGRKLVYRIRIDNTPVDYKIVYTTPEGMSKIDLTVLRDIAMSWYEDLKKRISDVVDAYIVMSHKIGESPL